MTSVLRTLWRKAPSACVCGSARLQSYAPREKGSSTTPGPVNQWPLAEQEWAMRHLAVVLPSVRVRVWQGRNLNRLIGYVARGFAYTTTAQLQSRIPIPSPAGECTVYLLVRRAFVFERRDL